jgi:hypothetical protein
MSEKLSPGSLDLTNSEYSGEKDRRVIRDPVGMVQGAVTRARREFRLSYLRNPEEFRGLPDDFFREDDTEEFKQAVHKGIIQALEAAKPYQVDILKTENEKVHEILKTNPAVIKLKEIFGRDVMRLAKAMEWYVDLCKGNIPSRVDGQYMHSIANKGIEVAEELLRQVTDPETAEKIENAFRDVCNLHAVDPESWESIKDLHGPEFVQELYKILGVHIGFQGLKEDEVERIARKHMERVKKYFLGDSSYKPSKTGEDSSQKKSWWKRIKKSPWLGGKKDRRTLDKLTPSLYIDFDKGLFAGLNGTAQLNALSELNKGLEGEYLGAIGVVQILDIAYWI